MHEIEFGSADVVKSNSFYQLMLGLQPVIQQEGLNVFSSGIAGVDFNTSSHFPPGTTCISFITDDLSEIENRLKEAGVSYEGPKPSHLGMSCIQFTDPDGYLIKVNSKE